MALMAADTAHSHISLDGNISALGSSAHHIPIQEVVIANYSFIVMVIWVPFTRSQ